MKLHGTWHEPHSWHWQVRLFHPSDTRHPPRALTIYSLRLLALALATSLWVALTLTTGTFSMAALILVGAAVGAAHLVLPKCSTNSHLYNLFILTLLGGLLANTLAGLALSSTLYGISYWQIVSAQQAPQNWPLLLGMFFDSFRAQDLAYYLMALATAFSLAKVHLCRK